MKKSLLILLALACLLTMCSCGNAPDTPDADTAATTTTVTTTTTESQTTTTATAEVKKPEPLDVNTEAKIKEDYAAHLTKSKIPTTADQVRIDHYYGTYQGDAVALFVSATTIAYAAVMVEETIAGYDFRFGSSKKLYIYHESEFTPLKEAYETGLVSKEDVKDIFEQRGKR